MLLPALTGCLLQVTKLLRLFQSVAVTLNKHYPARLYRLYLVDAPMVIQWPLQVGSMVHEVRA